MARRVGDGKANELAASRTLNPRPEAVVDEGFRSAEFFDARDLVQHLYHPGQNRPPDGRRRGPRDTVAATRHHRPGPGPEGITTTTPPGGGMNCTRCWAALEFRGFRARCVM